MNTNKKLFYFFIFVCSIGCFTACENDLPIETICTKNVNLSADQNWNKKAIEAYSLYREDIKQENYQDAAKHLKTIINLAPCFRRTTFSDGVVLYQHLIEHASNAIEQQRYIDEFNDLKKLRYCCFGQ